MAKINRRQEIKDKEALQLRFQFALSQSSKNVLNWLPKQNAEAEQPDTASPESRASFLSLPIVDNGAGLHLLEKSTSHNTVGDFLASDKMTKRTNDKRQDARTGLRAMTALMHRMRDDTRKKVHEKGARSAGRPKVAQKPKVAANTADSDEEESKSAQIRAKNTKGMDFGKKKRPF